MKLSDKGRNLIFKWEGLKLNPYLCSAGVPTIGVGSTMYANGTKVTLKDKKITKEQALELFNITVVKYENYVNGLVTSDINQNQFDALVSWVYNLGPNSLRVSTLLKKVNKDPDDVSIEGEFLKWCMAGGKRLEGLYKRRVDESKLYFTNDETKTNSDEKQ